MFHVERQWLPKPSNRLLFVIPPASPLFVIPQRSGGICFCSSSAQPQTPGSAIHRALAMGGTYKLNPLSPLLVVLLRSPPNLVILSAAKDPRILSLLLLLLVLLN